MDFAPYQSSAPEHTRVASPNFNQTRSPRASLDAAIVGRGAATAAAQASRPFSPSLNATYNARTPPPLQHPQPQRGWSGFDGQSSGWGGGGGGTSGGNVYGGSTPGAYPTAEMSEFDTSLRMRLDYEASLAYLAFPPLGAIGLLILEKNSDYVR